MNDHSPLTIAIARDVQAISQRLAEFGEKIKETAEALPKDPKVRQFVQRIRRLNDSLTTPRGD